LLALGSFVILNTINPNLVNFTDPVPNEQPKITDIKDLSSIVVLGQRTPGFYHFSYQEKLVSPTAKPVWRYSAPYESLALCKDGRDSYITLGFPKADVCIGYKIASNYYYETYNFVGSRSGKVTGFTNVADCVNSSQAFKTKSVNDSVNKSKGFKAGCFDDNGVFYDSSLQPEVIAPTTTYDWCLVAIHKQQQTAINLQPCFASEQLCNNSYSALLQSGQFDLTACAQR